MEIGEYLKYLRKQKGLTITQVVVKSNHEIDKTTISRVEAGNRKLSLKNAYHLSRVYDIDLEGMAEMAIGVKLPPPKPHFDISSEEKRMILQHRKFSPVLRVAVKNIFNRLSFGHAPCGGGYLEIREPEAEYETGNAIDDKPKYIQPEKGSDISNS